MRYFLDTYALIEIANGNPDYKKYLEDEAVTFKGNLAELYYFFLRQYDLNKAIDSFNKFSKIVEELPLIVIPHTVTFKFKYKKMRLSYIDCFGYIYALESGRVFLTGDRAFKGMKNVEIV